MNFDKKSVIWLFGIMSAIIIIFMGLFFYILPFAMTWVAGSEPIRTLSNEVIFRMFIFFEIAVLIISIFVGFMDFNSKNTTKEKVKK